MPDQQIRFIYQAESDRSKADTLSMTDGRYATHVTATVDGKPMRLGQTGAGGVNRFPFQGEAFLATPHNLPPGKHILQFALRGEGGTHLDSKTHVFRDFKGTLVSNPVQFEIIPEKGTPTSP